MNLDLLGCKCIIILSHKLYVAMDFIFRIVITCKRIKVFTEVMFCKCGTTNNDLILYLENHNIPTAYEDLKMVKHNNSKLQVENKIKFTTT